MKNKPQQLYPDIFMDKLPGHSSNEFRSEDVPISGKIWGELQNPIYNETHFKFELELHLKNWIHKVNNKKAKFGPSLDRRKNKTAKKL